ncbi:hypothetical protein DP939_29420 [Spongiactinospora rosea]|uniref:Uncharacterized protein n=1 Tax=Spongiactinospora rosea TaxID=2248750 RepID=A0A366LRC6_9ACTN|nr:hypothetical protein [Spongiactinospora rosea]RBQ16448.1 hypothetical protein DP939_29420 [Spongiactinospora rosea]
MTTAGLLAAGLAMTFAAQASAGTEPTKKPAEKKHETVNTLYYVYLCDVEKNNVGHWVGTSFEGIYNAQDKKHRRSDCDRYVYTDDSFNRDFKNKKSKDSHDREIEVEKSFNKDDSAKGSYNKEATAKDSFNKDDSTDVNYEEEKKYTYVEADKADHKKHEWKKPEYKKPEEKKSDEKWDDEKKSDDKKSDDKKYDEKKYDHKKHEYKKPGYKKSGLDLEGWVFEDSEHNSAVLSQD